MNEDFYNTEAEDNSPNAAKYVTIFTILFFIFGTLGGAYFIYHKEIEKFFISVKGNHESEERSNAGVPKAPYDNFTDLQKVIGFSDKMGLKIDARVSYRDEIGRVSAGENDESKKARIDMDDIFVS